jgi:hypothetical protein
LAVPRSLRGAINLGTNAEGRRVLTVDNSARTTDINFKAIQRTINSPGRVELNVISPATPIEFGRRDGTVGLIPQFGMLGLRGITLPSPGTATRRDETFSTESGVTKIFISNARTAPLSGTYPPQELAPVVAGEIGAHALPALLGLGAHPVTDEQHEQREFPYADNAKRNAQQ